MNSVLFCPHFIHKDLSSYIITIGKKKQWLNMTTTGISILTVIISDLVVFFLEVELGSGILDLPVSQCSSLNVLLLLGQPPLQVGCLQLLSVEELCPLVLVLLRTQPFLL